MPRRLPTDLWREIFQRMPLADILVLMQVCPLWRTIAIESDAYVSDIGLSSNQPAAAHLFLLRLGRSRSRQSTVRIIVEPNWDMLSTVILPTISAHLTHIGELSVECHSTDFVNVVAHLRCPAPRMHTLRLLFIVDDYPATLPYLPSDLLANEAPQLRVLALSNVELSPASIPPALSGVVHLQMGNLSKRWTVDYDLTTNFWRGFSSLKALTILPGTILSHPVHMSPQSWVNMDRFYLHSSSSNWGRIFADMPFLHSLRVIEVHQPFIVKVDSCMAHLPGPLDVVIRHMHTQHSELCLSDRSNHRLRVFTSIWRNGTIFPSGHVFPQDAYDVLYAVVLSDSRVLSLTISNTLWPQFSLMPLPYNDLVSLRIVLEDNSRLASPRLELGKPVQCPLLSTLILRCDFDTAWRRCEDVIAFFKAALHISDDAGRPRCSLVLENVVLEGEKDDLGKYFREVQYCDPNTWSYPSYR